MSAGAPGGAAAAPSRTVLSRAVGAIGSVTVIPISSRPLAAPGFDLASLSFEEPPIPAFDLRSLRFEEPPLPGFDGAALGLDESPLPGFDPASVGFDVLPLPGFAALRFEG